MGVKKISFKLTYLIDFVLMPKGFYKQIRCSQSNEHSLLDYGCLGEIRDKLKAIGTSCVQHSHIIEKV